MPFCPRCGVEVDNGVAQCSLCCEAVPILQDEPIAPARFPRHSASPQRGEGRRKRRIGWAVLSGAIFTAALIVLVIDLLTAGAISWSRWTIIALLYSAAVESAILLLYPKRTLVLALGGLSTMLFLSGINNFAAGSWFTPIALPITAAATTLSTLLSALVDRGEKRLALLSAHGLGALALLAITTDAAISRRGGGATDLSWSLIVLVSVLPLTLMLLLWEMKIKHLERIKKYLHL